MVVLVSIFFVLGSALAWAAVSKKQARSQHKANKTVKFYYSPKSEKIKKLSYNIMEDIVRAQALLKNKPAGFRTVAKKVKVGKGKKAKVKVFHERIGKPNFRIAVMNVHTRKIKTVIFNPDSKVSGGFNIKIAMDNGVATRFAVISPDKWVYLAHRTTIYPNGKGEREVIYTSYTPEIDTLQNRQAGLAYLKDTIKSAGADLRRIGLRSLGYKGLVSDAVPENVALMLSLVEHIDHGRLNKTPIKQLVHECLIIIAANRQDAYKYSVSSAGARGLFQFIPSTYSGVAKVYPRAKLKKNFVEGMGDHANAAKATLLLFDSDLAETPNNWRQYFAKNGYGMGRFLAAAYNFGAKRTKNLVFKYGGQNWEKHLPEETQMYLKKFDAVWAMRNRLAAD